MEQQPANQPLALQEGDTSEMFISSVLQQSKKIRYQEWIKKKQKPAWDETENISPLYIMPTVHSCMNGGHLLRSKVHSNAEKGPVE